MLLSLILIVFLCISVSAEAINPNGINMLIANGLSTFPIKYKQVYSTGPRILPRNPHK